MCLAQASLTKAARGRQLQENLSCTEIHVHLRWILTTDLKKASLFSATKLSVNTQLQGFCGWSLDFLLSQTKQELGNLLNLLFREMIPMSSR